MHLTYLLVRDEALRLKQHLISHVVTFSLVEPVLSNKDEVTYSKTHILSPDESPTRDLAIKSPASGSDDQNGCHIFIPYTVKGEWICTGWKTD